ncbi:unnamed protein product [Gordionus sp. m RMFG-2023]
MVKPEATKTTIEVDHQLSLTHCNLGIIGPTLNSYTLLDLKVLVESLMISFITLSIQLVSIIPVIIHAAPRVEYNIEYDINNDAFGIIISLIELPASPAEE